MDKFKNLFAKLVVLSIRQKSGIKIPSSQGMRETKIQITRHSLKKGRISRIPWEDGIIFIPVFPELRERIFMHKHKVSSKLYYWVYLALVMTFSWVEAKKHARKNEDLILSLDDQDTYLR